AGDRRERAPARAGRAHPAPPHRRHARRRRGALRAARMSDSLARALVCIDCAAAYHLEYRLVCECGGLLELRYDVDVLCRGRPGLYAGRGLWRYAPVLRIADPAHRVT